MGRIYDYKATYSQYLELRKERREQQMKKYEEEIVVALAVVRREMILLNRRLLNRLHLLLTGSAPAGCRQLFGSFRPL